MVWIEPTTNPTLKMTDVKAVCEMAKLKNPQIIVGVDNTFCSPYFFVIIIYFKIKINVNYFLINTESFDIGC
jgi:cystathionine beta-lyase/cystathionine gamma-synthase